MEDSAGDEPYASGGFSRPLGARDLGRRARIGVGSDAFIPSRDARALARSLTPPLPSPSLPPLTRVSQAELSEANASRRDLVERVEQKNAEIADKNATLESHLAKVVAASEERSKAESKLRDATSSSAAFESAKARMEQEARLMQEHNDWLRAEVAKKSDDLLAARKAASADVLQAAEALEEAKREAASAKRELASASERLAASQAAARKAQEETRGEREASAKLEAHFDKELATARRLGELHKKQADARAEKITELEGVMTALRDHLSEVKEESRRTLAEERKAREEATKALTEAKLNFDGRVQAALEGARRENAENIALPAPTLAMDASDRGPAAASGRTAGALLSMQLPDASAAALRRENLTMTELYTKYAEAADAWRKECFERKRLQQTIDGMIEELERKAPMLAEQREEYDRAVAAHGEMRRKLENAAVELRRLEAEAKSHAANERHAARKCAGLEAQSADLSRQVQLLLREVTELKRGGPGGPGGGVAARRAAGDGRRRLRRHSRAGRFQGHPRAPGAEQEAARGDPGSERGPGGAGRAAQGGVPGGG